MGLVEVVRIREQSGKHVTMQLVISKDNVPLHGEASGVHLGVNKTLANIRTISLGTLPDVEKWYQNCALVKRLKQMMKQ